MDRGTQAHSFGFNINPALGRPRNEAEGGIGVAESVVGAFPVRMIIAGPEMGDAQCGGEGYRTCYIGGRSAVAQRG